MWPQNSRPASVAGRVRHRVRPMPVLNTGPPLSGPCEACRPPTTVASEEGPPLTSGPTRARLTLAHGKARCRASVIEIATGNGTPVVWHRLVPMPALLQDRP